MRWVPTNDYHHTVFQMQNERIKTEEHIEYDSDDTPESGKLNFNEIIKDRYWQFLKIKFLTLLRVALVFKDQLLFKTVLHHNALS